MCVYERKREKPSKLLMTPVHTETARGIECETEAETEAETVFHVPVAVSLTLLIWVGKMCMLRRKSDMKPL